MSSHLKRRGNSNHQAGVTGCLKRRQELADFENVKETIDEWKDSAQTSINCEKHMIGMSGTREPSGTAH